MSVGCALWVMLAFFPGQCFHIQLLHLSHYLKSKLY